MQTATKDIVDLLGKTFDLCQSPSLRLEKFVVQRQKDKNLEIEQICRCANTKKNLSFPKFSFHRISGAEQFVMTTQSRLLINHSGGILENTGLCLHRFHGTPMIPGSAQKGIARKYALEAVRGAADDATKCQLLLKTALTFGWSEQDWSEPKPSAVNDKKPLSAFVYACTEHRQIVWEECARELADITGTTIPDKYQQEPWKVLPNFAGTIAFLPARVHISDDIQTIPNKLSLSLLDPDIVNCHHSKYYQDERQNRIALDIESPIPNFFPAVCADLDFLFVLLPLRALEKDVSFSPLAFGGECLRGGLSEYGIGAKTSAGYGWLEINETKTQTLQKERDKAEEERRAQEAFESMTPEEQELAKFMKSLPKSDELGALKGMIAKIDSLSVDEQRMICLAFKLHFAKEWASDCRDAQKAKGPDDKKNGKAFRRVEALRNAARKTGVDLT